MTVVHVLLAGCDCGQVRQYGRLS